MLLCFYLVSLHTVKTCAARSRPFLPVDHKLQITMDGGLKAILEFSKFPVAFERVNHDEPFIKIRVAVLLLAMNQPLRVCAHRGV